MNINILRTCGFFLPQIYEAAYNSSLAVIYNLFYFYYEFEAAVFAGDMLRCHVAS